MTCGRRRFEAANGCDSVRRRISARLAVIRAEAAASAFLAAVALRQLLRCSGCSALQPNAQPVSGILFSVSPAGTRQQISHQRGGSDGRTSATAQKAKTLHACLDATRLYRVSHTAAATRMGSHAISSSSASGSFYTRLGEPWHSCPRQVYFRGAMSKPQVRWRPEGSVGAT